MADIILSIIKIKPGKLNRLKKWCNELQKRKKEVVETLRKEKVYTESAFLHKTKNGNFLIYYIEAEDFSRAMNVYKKSKRKIDKEHKQVLKETLDKQCFKPVLLLHFKSGLTETNTNHAL